MERERERERERVSENESDVHGLELGPRTGVCVLWSIACRRPASALALRHLTPACLILASMLSFDNHWSAFFTYSNIADKATSCIV